MKLKIFYSLLLLFILFACSKKEYPKDKIQDGEATFFSTLMINGSPLKLEAGKNDYYMYSSFDQDSNNVYGFIGELRSAANGAGSPNTLRIQLNDAGISTPNGSSNISSLIPGPYRFYDASNAKSYGVEFESTYNRIPKTYNWDFGDGTTSNEANPIHYFKNSGNFSACLSIEGNNTCNSSVCNPINISANSFNAYVSSIGLGNNKLQFTANTLGGKAPFTHYWSFGDGSSDISASPVHKYIISGSYPVKLTIKDADGKTNFISYNVVTETDQSSCSSNIKIKSILPVINNIGLSEVILSFTDAKGMVFSSQLGSQLNSSSFNVLSVENFDTNERGEKTKKIRLNFNCKLYSGTQQMSIEGTECVICVAYK